MSYVGKFIKREEQGQLAQSVQQYAHLTNTFGTFIIINQSSYNNRVGYIDVQNYVMAIPKISNQVRLHGKFPIDRNTTAITIRQ